MNDCVAGTSVALVGDIGATHVRLGLKRDGMPRPQAVAVLDCADYATPEAAIRDYLGRNGCSTVARACLAVAAPSGARRLRMTNHPWCFDVDRMRQRFGWRSLKMVNDFTAMALGVPYVQATDRIAIGGGPAKRRRPQLVMGPGTGLGVSALVPVPSGWVPLETEGGHVDFAPANELEMALLRILRLRFGRVSLERILSGPGLLNLYQAHAELQQVPVRLHTPEAISTAALDLSDALARQVLEHFCEILGRAAGNAVLTLGSAGGVHLCGGILPKMADILLHSRFRAAFEDKGRMRPMMQCTPVYLITDPLTGLVGAGVALDRADL